MGAFISGMVIGLVAGVFVGMVALAILGMNRSEEKDYRDIND